GIEFTALRLNVPNTRNRFLFPKHLAVRCLLCHKIANGEGQAIRACMRIVAPFSRKRGNIEEIWAVFRPQKANFSQFYTFEKNWKKNEDAIFN
ncbi:MAG: hypothetical protein LBJ14_09410, partial [Desulfarculales bacterium]|nr:hypothetical protein [Desulfarculales bacterium]